jgi:hypothetical protein
MHIEQVLGDVPREKRCTCREKKEKAGSAEKSLFERWFGR